MAQEANGFGVSTATSPNSIGAVFFDKATDYHADNLARFEQARQRARAEEEKKKLATANLFKDLKLDTEGILDTDTDYFHQRINGLEDYIKEGLKSGVDPTSPSGRQWYSMYKNMAEKLELDMLTSKNQRENIAKANALAIEKGGDVEETQDRSFKYASIPFDQRNKTADWTKLYVSKLPELQKSINETWNAAKSTIFDVSEKVKEEGGIIKVEKVSTLPNSRVWNLSKGFMLNNSYDVDKTFNALPTQDKAFYADLARIEGHTSGSPVDAKTAFVYEKFKPFAGQQETLTGVEETSERKELAKDVVEQKSSDALYQVVQGLSERNPEVFQKSIDGNVYLDKNGNMISTKLTGTIFGTREVPKEVRDIGGKPTIVSTETVPNKIVAVRINKSNPNIYEIRTDKDVADDETGDVYSMRVSAKDFPQQLWTYNYKDPASGFRYLQNSAKKFADVSKTGIVTPTQTYTTAKTVSLDKTIPQQGVKSTLTKEGVPVFEKKEQQKTKLTPTQWNEEWNKLKKGQTMVGLDGKTYTKK